MSKYDDIINLPHHVSKTRKHMSMESRAAQFAPFSALTGHGDAINETARLTSSRLELSQEMLDSLTIRLAYALDRQTSVTVTYFEPDPHKKGGKYVTASGVIKRVDDVDGTIVFSDKRSIRLADIYSLEGDIYRDFE
ncbi:MAG: YolD-like family protein [Muribaculaceae bacterium]|nr:YolD-like family protein [Muribaculaceae bacterium]